MKNKKIIIYTLLSGGLAVSPFNVYVQLSVGTSNSWSGAFIYFHRVLCKQRKLWRDCVDAQACLIAYGWIRMESIPKSLMLAHILSSRHIFSRTPDRYFHWFYPCEIILSHISVPARWKAKKQTAALRQHAGPMWRHCNVKWCHHVASPRIEGFLEAFFMVFFQ